MRVIIIGAGKVGYNLAQTLSMENHDVVVIEKNQDRFKVVEETLDVRAILGTGASSEILEEAGIRDANLLIAVTESDELNMIACLMAKEYGVPKTVARVRNPEYADNHILTQSSKLNIDLLINPEKVTAKEIFKLIEVPEAIDVEYFANGKIQLLELKIKDDSPILNKHLKDISMPYRFLIVAILRNEEMIIPHGNDQILKDDIIFILATTKDMIGVEKNIGIDRSKTDNVIILGGGRIGYYLAKMLETTKVSAKIIEKDQERCKQIAQDLNNVMILYGDGTDIDLLKEEGVQNTDLFISLTDDDKLNLLVSLLAKHLGIKKTIAQIRRSDYLPLVERVGIDVAVSPRILTTAAILKFIRKGKIVSVSLIGGAKAEMIEMIVPDNKKIVNKYIKDLSFPKGALIGAIFRNEDVLIPSGNDYLLPRDRIIVFTLPKAISKVEAFFS